MNEQTGEHVTPVMGRPVTREDRVRAVWRGFQREAATGRYDTLMRLWFRRLGGMRGRGPMPVPMRWHLRLRPWCYPDPPIFRRGMRLFRVPAQSGSSSTSREEGVGLSPSDEERASEGSSDLTSVPPPPDPQQAAESGSDGGSDV